MAIITEYLKWLKDNTVETPQDNGWIEIATPFMDRHNDGLLVYVKNDRGRITISDDGYIIGDMELSGINVNKRYKSIEEFMHRYGVSINDNKELEIHANSSNYPQKQHLLLQAMMSASDMFTPTLGNTKSIFIDDVVSFFEANNIFYTPDTQFQGKSGYVHKVDFVIPKCNKYPERFVYAINSPKINNIKSTLFMWADIQANRPVENKMVAILNDNKSIPDEAINAFHNYNAMSVSWTSRDSILENLRIA